MNAMTATRAPAGPPHEHHLWIKYGSATELAPEMPVAEPTLMDCATTIELPRDIAAAAKRPPNRVAAFITPQSGVDSCRSTPGGRKELRADPNKHGGWGVDDAFGGAIGSDQVFDILPFIGTRDQARDWILSDAGRAWLGGANAALIWFATGGSLLDPPFVVAAPEGPESSKFTNRMPLDQWRNDYRLERYRDPPSLPPGSWRSQLAPIQAALEQHVIAPAEEECAAIQAAMQTLPAHRDEVLTEAVGMRAFRRVQAVLGDPYASMAKPHTVRLLDLLYANLRAPTFTLKRHFARARPEAVCPALTPLFVPGDALYPAHASYPGGHAVRAYALAYLYADRAQALGRSPKDFLDAAQQTAHLRVVAGFHFPSDNAAGAVAARMLVDALKDSPPFQTVLDAAIQEWVSP